jgi:hypothetical protein
MDKRTKDELTQEELDELGAELLPRREALSVIGPPPAAPGADAATDLPQIADAEVPTTPEGE